MERKSILNDEAALYTLLNSLDTEVSIILDPSLQMKIKDNKIEAWIGTDFEYNYNTKPQVEPTVVLYMLQFCLNNNLGIKLNGLADEFEFIFDASQIVIVEPIIKASTFMIKYITDEITEESLVSEIQDTEVYFIGSFPNENGEISELATLESEDSENLIIPVFLTAYDIEDFNTDDMSITGTTLGDVLYFFNGFNIAIEPGKEYCTLIHN